MKNKFYISTAIAYTSSKPHLGNTYDVVLADVIARYKRLRGYDVYFQTGTDEHGEKIELKARENNISPQEYVDNIASCVKDVWVSLNTSYDKFVRTTNSKHKELASKIFDKLYEKGDIYKGNYKGLYCVPCESFWTESQLVSGNCPDCGRPVKEASEECYFFKTSNYSRWLYDYIESHPGFIEPESRKNEIINNFIKPGLQDLCVSRTTFKWGIPVSFDSNHVIYVWIDALSNYITFLGYDPYGPSSLEFKKYWPCDLHMIGKDILRFHAIYWPIILHCLGLEMPKKIFAHPWLLFSNDKMSKSKGNIVYAEDLISKYGVDAVRFYLLHDIPFGSDGNYTEELFIDSINTNLANVLGNLVNRTIGMANKYFSGKITNTKEYADVDKELVDLVLSLDSKIENDINNVRISDSLDKIMEVYRRCNKYIDETEPWVLYKENKLYRLNTVIYNLIESIRIATVFLQAYLPDTANEIFKQLNTDINTMDSVLEFGQYNSDMIGEASPLFKRIEK